MIRIFRFSITRLLSTLTKSPNGKHTQTAIYPPKKAFLNIKHTTIGRGIPSHNLLSRSIASLADFGLGMRSICVDKIEE